jgi:hypothetical protein
MCASACERTSSIGSLELPFAVKRLSGLRRQNLQRGVKLHVEILLGHLHIRVVIRDGIVHRVSERRCPVNCLFVPDYVLEVEPAAGNSLVPEHSMVLSAVVVDLDNDGAKGGVQKKGVPCERGQC